MNASDLYSRLAAFGDNGRLRSLPAWLGGCALVALLVAGAFARFQLPPVALAEWDSWGWLGPALSWIGGSGFHEEFEREWLYGAFIASALRLTGSFAGYILIQQTLGLLAAVLMWLTWRRWVALFPRNFWLELLSLPLGLFAIALYLFNPIVLTLELSIRPEAILAFVAFLQLFCVISFCKFRWLEHSTPACIIYGALSLPLAWAMFVLKPNWALAVPLTTLPVFVSIIFGTAPRLARWAPLLTGLALIVLTIWIPDKLLFLRNGQARTVLPMTLFTIHADIIRDAMTDEHEDTNTAPERKVFLEEFIPLLNQEIEAATAGNKYYRWLGFDPDYLMYRSPLFPKLGNHWKMNRGDLAEFCRQNFVAAIFRDPFAYAGKVSRQMEIFIFPDDRTFFSKRIRLNQLYTHAAETVPDSPDAKLNPRTQELMQSYITLLAAQGNTDREIEVIPRFRSFLKSARPLFPALGLAFLLALGACLTWTPLAAHRLPGLCALLIIAAPAGNALTIAMVHALDNARYRGSYGPLLIFAYAALAYFLIVTVCRAAHALSQRAFPHNHSHPSAGPTP